MNHIRPLAVILVFSLLGELLQHLLPFPLPASVYGMILLFIALATKLLPREAVKGTGAFLVSLLPLLFVVPIVGIVSSFSLIARNLVGIVVTIAVPTVLTFAVSGLVTQRLLKKKEGGEENG